MSIDFPPDDPRGRELMLMVERGKYERWIMGQVDALLEREFERVVDLMLSPKFRTLTAFQKQRTQQLFREISTRLGAGYRDVVTLVTREMQGYAQLEADIARVQATSVLTAGGGELTISLGPSLPRTYLSAIARLPIQGLMISDWFETQASSMSMNAKRIIQQGLVEGKGPAEIARRLSADARTEGAVLSRRAKQEARAIVRTTVNAVQNDAALASYQTLPPSVSDSWRFLAVRDARTTTICAALDGRIFRNDDATAPRPPRHVGCRSGVMPVIKGGDLTIAQQKSGPMSFASYADWLKDQSIGVQNDILGVTRAGFWRDGRMSLADAVDADNRLLTVAQLRERLGIPVTTAK